jgi:hypothetical protein
MNLDGIFDFVGGILKPATDLVDKVSTTDQERMLLKKALKEIEVGLQSKLLDYEKEKMRAQASIIRAEAGGQSWLQRNWRPITMLTFLVLVVFDCFGVLAFRLSKEAWTLLQIGLGGYVVGRSGEKIVKKLKDKE